jgi:hypothetical protein
MHYDEMYNDEQIADATGVPTERAWEMLEWYARLELEKKILKWVKEKGECQFEAEC